MQFVKTFAEALLQLSILLPFIWLNKQCISRSNMPCLAVFVLLFLLDTTVARSLNISIFNNQEWNWAGKTGSVVWALIFVYSTELVAKKDMGWTVAVQNPKSIFITILVLLCVRLPLKFIFHNVSTGYKPETFLYQATLPGLSEEIVFRGIFLALLNQVFTPRWTFLKTTAGWGLVLTSLLFGAVHGLTLSTSRMPHFNSQRFVMTGALGFVLGLLKERSKSLVPGILFHNAWNIIAYWGK